MASLPEAHSPGRHPYRSLTGSHHSALPGRCPPSTFRETSSIHDVVDENLTRCITSRFGGLELAMLAPAAGESTSSGTIHEAEIHWHEAHGNRTPRDEG